MLPALDPAPAEKPAENLVFSVPCPSDESLSASAFSSESSSKEQRPAWIISAVFNFFGNSFPRSSDRRRIPLQAVWDE